MGVEDALAGEIDRLYGLPLAEFTSERDALARRLRSEGSRDEAAEVAALRKPVLAAWVVNRLAREQRADVQALVAAAGAIRSGDPDADGRFRKTVDDLLRSAREQIAADGRRPTEAVLRDVATTLRAAAGAAPDLLTTGRLTEPFEATGFEAMAGAVPQRRGSTREKKKRDTAQADRARIEEAQKALAAARDQARKLAREADKAERDARRLRADADAAERRAAEAGKRLEQARRR
ncbi:MAG TPA: hypothetical protein VHH57_01490 [Gaiella sp.]|nr:hypothetical protein [Gaiella sp.]